MRKINFKKIKMKNFGPYIDEMDLSLEGDKFIVISGPNGIGKTMLFDSIPFTLYGITTKGMRGDDLVNNVIGKNCKTSVEFDIIDENNEIDKYKVTRYQKYTRHGNTVLLYKNNFSDPIKKGHREVVLELERLIAPKELFLNSLMFGQRVKDFFTDLDDSKKKEIFRKLIDLDIYQQYKDEASNRLKELMNLMLENSSDHSMKNALVCQISDQINNIELEKEEFDRNKNENIKRLNLEINEMKEIHNKNNILYNELKTFLKDNDQENIYKTISEYKNAINNIDEEIDKLNDKLNKEEIELLEKIETNLINDLNKKINLYNEEINIIKNDSYNEKIIIENNIEKKIEIIDETFRVETDKYNDDLKKIQDNKNILETNKDKIDSENNKNIEKYNKDRNNIIDKINNIVNDKNLINAKILNKQNEITNITIKRDTIKDSVFGKTESICPTCNSKIVDENIKNKLLKEIEGYEELIKLYNSDVLEYNNVVKSLNNQENNLKNDLEIIETNHKDIIKKYENSKEYLKELYLSLKEDYDKITSEYKIKTDEYTKTKHSIIEDKKKLTSELDNNLIEKSKVINNKIILLENNIKNKIDNEKIKIKSEIEIRRESENKQLFIKKYEIDKKIKPLILLYEDIKEKKTQENNLRNVMVENFKTIEYKIELLKTQNELKFQSENQLKKLNENIIILNKEIKKLDEIKKELEMKKEILEFWNKSFSSSGIPSMLIDEAIPFMNERISYYMDKLSNSRYVVSFDTLSETKGGEYRDKISVNVYDTITKANNRSQLSGGQKRLVDIGTILTISDLHTRYHNVKFNFVIFDEIFDSLDERNIQYTSKVLKTLSNEKTVCVISHQHLDELDQMDCDEILKL